MNDDLEFDSWYRADLTETDQSVAQSKSRSDPEHMLESSGALRWLHHIEAWLCAIFGTMLFCFIVMMLLLLNNLAMQVSAAAFLLLVVSLMAVFEGPFLFRMWRATAMGQRPIGYAVAKQYPVRRPLLRLVAAVWWLAHVAAGVMVVVSAEVHAIRIMRQGNQMPNVAGQSVFMGVMMFGMSVCCNTFIALMVKALFGSDYAVALFWRWRLVVDLGVTLFALLIASGL
jgi:hypothetical protein